MTTDPHQWLEEVEGEAALAWVREQNAATIEAFTHTEPFGVLRDRLRAILDSDDRIPYVAQHGSFLTNFWRDAEHPRGLWRRTTFEDYASGNPQWETLLDLDSLAEKEGENWVFAGATFCRPNADRALVMLSRGGADATVVREFDLNTKAFVTDGFVLKEAKVRIAWIDADTLFVGTDFGPGSMTDSGYPRTVRRWHRGTSIDDAEIIFDAQATDVSVAGWHQADRNRSFITVRPDFFSETVFRITPDGNVLLPKPPSAIFEVFQDWVLFELREDWTTGDTTFPQGSLLAAPFDEACEGNANWRVLFAPTATRSLAEFAITKNHIVLNTLEDVKNRLFVVSHANGTWSTQPLFTDDRHALDTVQVVAVDRYDSDAIWTHRSGFTTPATFGHAELPGGVEQPLRASPAMFDATEVQVSQHFATSKDGTRVPYFQVAKTSVLEQGPAPTLIRGYGGFEVSLLPGYEAITGTAWLEAGGVYIVANIRGGGEYGPRWHQAALRAERPRAYEDFEAIGHDLVARQVTTPKKLTIRGGSNGGLLMGNLYLRAPALFAGAVVCQVPLLDMKRYTKLLAGASWAAEYGNPDDPEQWSFIQTFSPYHMLHATDDLHPPLLLTTSTRDDRVHPGHARKFRAKLAELKRPNVWYYENIEGGHGGAANNEQVAFLTALSFTFLWRMMDRV
ncbi:MAG: prolyl oligopeptidase family serine peptidase [Myxococcota bacterium]